MWIFHWPSTFFGLTPKNKPDIHEEVFALCYYGQGGFTHDEVYNMPIYLRRFYLKEIKKVQDRQQQEMDKIKSQSKR